MGQGIARILEPEPLAQFKKGGSTNIPETEDNRRAANKKFLVIFFIFVGLLLPFLIYSLIKADIKQLTHGYDECGNVCGRKNYRYDQWSCTGKDFTNEKYLEIEPGDYGRRLHWKKADRRCVRACRDGYAEKGWTCENKTVLEAYDATDEYDSYLRGVAWKIALCIAIGLVILLLIILLLMCCMAFVVWVSIGVSIAFFIAAVIWFWILFGQLPFAEPVLYYGVLALAILFTIILLFVIVYLVKFYRKILLTIQLLKEAVKGFRDMPLLILTPFTSFISVIIVSLCAVATTVWMCTAGDLQKDEKKFHYHLPSIIIFTMVYNWIIWTWAALFIQGISHMVIGGAVAKWYFTDKMDALDNPISTSARITFKFHLGSVVFGSMVILFADVVKALIDEVTHYYSSPATDGTSRLVNYLSKNAYLTVAMHGEPFYQSGKRAVTLLCRNILNVIMINVVVNYVVAMVILIPIIITGAIAYGIFQGEVTWNSMIAYGIVFVAVLFMVYIFITILNTNVDTILLCLCEDELLNDGYQRPYAMSEDLKKFADDSKVVFGLSKTAV